MSQVDLTNVGLTREEVEVLVQILQDFRSELRMEIAGTDSGYYRQGLKHEREVLDHILVKLQAGLA
ncbi:MAG: hypothetical protein DCC57_24045 [Chloroflexi bacterium]|nr:MAG: hypothetical protein DCC57_24045 [Chloroflexota bacterium]